MKRQTFFYILLLIAIIPSTLLVKSILGQSRPANALKFGNDILEVQPLLSSKIQSSKTHSKELINQNLAGKKAEQISWHEVEPGYSIARVALGVTSYLISSELLLVKIDPKLFRLSLIRASDLGQKLLPLREMTNNSGGLLGINTHFFDPSGKPLGLLIRKGKLEHRLQLGGSVLTGVFSLIEGKPRIVHRSLFAKMPPPELALQAGPRLIESGKKVTLNAKVSTSRRSGIAITKSGEVILYATFLRFPGASLPQIQDFLIKSNLEVTDALNLDGGGSSQLFVVSNSASREGIYISGGDPVPVGLVVKRMVSSSDAK